MEEYITSTDPTQCITSIDAIIEHDRGEFCKETLVYEMQQDRRYELLQSMSPITEVHKLGEEVTRGVLNKI